MSPSQATFDSASMVPCSESVRHVMCNELTARPACPRIEKKTSPKKQSMKMKETELKIEIENEYPTLIAWY